MNLNCISDLRQLLCPLMCHRYGGNAITEPNSWLWIWTLVPFWDTIVSDRASHHLKEFKLHFNLISYFRCHCYQTDNHITSELWIIHIWTGSYMYITNQCLLAKTKPLWLGFCVCFFWPQPSDQITSPCHLKPDVPHPIRAPSTQKSAHPHFTGQNWAPMVQFLVFWSQPSPLCALPNHIPLLPQTQCTANPLGHPLIKNQPTPANTEPLWLGFWSFGSKHAPFTCCQIHPPAT